MRLPDCLVGPLSGAARNIFLEVLHELVSHHVLCIAAHSPTNHSSLRTNTMSLIITDFAGSNHRVAVHTT